MGDNETTADPGSVKFQSILQVDVPKGRDGKHKQIILQILENLDRLNEGSALKIRLSELPDTKENIRSALGRAARQKNLDIATSSNEAFLFVWKSTKANHSNGESTKNPTGI
jgi:hypothetical protein